MGSLDGSLVGLLNFTQMLANMTNDTTVEDTPEPDEYWRCSGPDCKVLGAEYHPYESDNKLTPTEGGLIAGIVIIGLLCVALIVVLVLLLKRVSTLDGLKSDIEDSKKNQYKVQRDLADTNEKLKAQDAMLKVWFWWEL